MTDRSPEVAAPPRESWLRRRRQRALQRRLERIADAPVNYEPPAEDRYSPDDGWVLDTYRRDLPDEAPGEPESDGSFRAAVDAMTDYAFADPRLITAHYDRTAELRDRTMLLTGKFLFLRFHMGARVNAVVDGASERDGRPVRVWGWSYQTLQGHLETGQMRFEAWKWLDTGCVEFRIDAASRPARIANPITRFGFRLFGRRLQLRFAHHALDRMERIVRDRLTRADAEAQRNRSRTQRSASR